VTGRTRGRTPSRIRIVARLAQALAGGPTSRTEWDCAVPPAAQDALRAALGLPVRSARLTWLHALLADLDRAAPRWRRTAMAMLVEGQPADEPVLRKVLATGLAARPLKRPDQLLEAVRQRTARAGDEDAPPCDDLLLALAGTDTVGTLESWASAFPAQLVRAAAEPEAGDGQRSLFLCLLKALQHRLLGYSDFAAAAVEGRALTAAHDGGRRAAPPFYHPVLDYLGISRSDPFRLAYQRLACELTAPGRAATWYEVSALRRYWGGEGLLEALRVLDDTPTDPVRLHLAKWTFGLEAEEAAGALAHYRPSTLMLLSLLRSDLDDAIGEALGCLEHGDRMRWLRLPARQAFRRAAADDALRAWSQRWGPDALGAIYALTQVGLPGPAGGAADVLDDVPDQQEAPDPERSESLAGFISEHVCAHFGRVLDNTNLIEALAGGHDDEIAERAREGWVPAVRALGLTQDQETARAETLVGLRRSGRRMS